MPLPLVLGLAAAAPGIIKTFQGIRQGIQANKLKAKDFQFIPPALRENLASQRNRARSARLPGQSLVESKVRQSTAGGLRAAGGGSLSDKIAAAQGLVAQEQDALSGIGAQAAQFQQGEERALQGLMGQKTNIELGNQRQFENTKLGLKDAATRNIFGGVSDIASSVTGGGFNNLFGGQKVQKQVNPLSTQAPNNFITNFANQNFTPNTLAPGTFNRFING
jgi:hypothetical protein